HHRTDQDRPSALRRMHGATLPRDATRTRGRRDALWHYVRRSACVLAPASASASSAGAEAGAGLSGQERDEPGGRGELVVADVAQVAVAELAVLGAAPAADAGVLAAGADLVPVGAEVGDRGADVDG